MSVPSATQVSPATSQAADLSTSSVGVQQEAFYEGVRQKRASHAAEVAKRTFASRTYHSLFDFISKKIPIRHQATLCYWEFEILRQASTIGKGVIVVALALAVAGLFYLTLVH